MAVSMIRAERRTDVGRARDDGGPGVCFGDGVAHGQNKLMSPLFFSYPNDDTHTNCYYSTVVDIIILLKIIIIISRLLSSGGRSENPVGLRAASSAGRS